MNKQEKTQLNKIRRAKRTRAKVKKASNAPRLSVFRSNKDMYFQIIDDKAGKTLVSVHTKSLKDSKKTKTEISFEAGKLLAKKAVEKKIEKVVFDKGSFKYHGRVKAAADGAREGGLKF